MCRLAIYGNLNGEFTPLARALNQLERSLGGDGNGFYHAATNEITKGLPITTAEIAKATYRAPHGVHTVFHTRMATAGKTTSALNHPFIAGDWVLAHNGHWHEWQDYDLDGLSDTECAAELVSMFGPGILLAPEFSGSGVWVLTREDETLVIPRSSRGFIFQWLKTGGYFHASEKIAHFRVKRAKKARANYVYRVHKKTGSVHIADDVMPEDIPDALYLGSPFVWSSEIDETRASGAYGSEDDIIDEQSLLAAWYRDHYGTEYREDFDRAQLSLDDTGAIDADHWLDNIPRTKWDAE